MNANPRCERCRRLMVWVGISSGAEPFCPDYCAPLHPDEICPKCHHFGTEDFEVQDMGPMGWFGPSISVTKRHCLACGHVFDKAA